MTTGCSVESAEALLGRFQSPRSGRIYEAVKVDDCVLVEIVQPSVGDPCKAGTVLEWREAFPGYLIRIG